MKVLLFAVTGVFLMAGLASGACRSVTVDGKQMQLCDRDTRAEQYAEQLRQEDPLNRPKPALPTTRYRNGNFETQHYSDGTVCTSTEVGTRGTVQTNCR